MARPPFDVTLWGGPSHLTQKGVPFRVNQVPNSTRWQIFLNDPNNVVIELNFDVASERAGAAG